MFVGQNRVDFTYPCGVKCQRQNDYPYSCFAFLLARLQAGFTSQSPQLKKCQSIKWNYNCSNNNICLLSLSLLKVFVFRCSPLYECIFFQTLIYSKLPPFSSTRHTNLKAMNLSLSQQRAHSMLLLDST